MVIKQIDDFDPTPYLTMPRLTVSGLFTLGKVLVELMPEGSWPEVAVAASRVSAAIIEGEAIMVQRIRDDTRFTRGDVKFDGFVDGLWGLFRDRLAGWLRFKSEGSQRLAEDEELEVDLEELEHRAERAAKLLELLFPDGLDLLRRSYNEQSQLMATVLEVIEAEGIGDELQELTGEELLPLLQACQRRYEAMVGERLARDPNTTVGDLREIMGRIHRYLYFYANAVINTLNHEKPNSVESVEAALQPIVNARLGRDILLGRRGGNAAGEQPAGLEELGEVTQAEVGE